MKLEKLLRALVSAASLTLIAIAALAGCATTTAVGPSAPGDLESLYRKRCSSCHELPRPSAHGDLAWRSIMPKMARDARLAEADAQRLTDWVTTVNGRD